MRECIVCQTAEHAGHYCTIDKQDYLHCGHCGLIYIDKQLKPEQLYKAYSGAWLKSFRRKLMAPFRRFHQAKNFETSMQRAKQIIEFTSKKMERDSWNIEYMDIGCNKGFLLATALEHKWNPHGVELVPELMAPFLNTFPKYRDQVFSERFEDVRKKHLQDNFFDVITGIDVVEHFEDVEADLAGIYAVLKPGGTFVLQTPDAGCQRARTEKCNWGALIQCKKPRSSGQTCWVYRIYGLSGI